MDMDLRVIFYMLDRANTSSHIAKNIGSMLIRHRSDGKVLIRRESVGSMFNRGRSRHLCYLYCSVWFLDTVSTELVITEDNDRQYVMNIMAALALGGVWKTWARKSFSNKLHIFQCMGKIFHTEFQREPLKFHTKFLTHILKEKIFIQYWQFRNSKIYEIVNVFETNDPPPWSCKLLHVCGHDHTTVKPVYDDHLMGYFSAFWSSSGWPRWAPEGRYC